jgi:hypothetical protein
METWSEADRVPLLFIQPGKPVENAFIESFNGRLRDECLNANWFLTAADARRKILAWMTDYNEARPHSSLNYLTPREYAAKGTEKTRLSGCRPSPSRGPVSDRTGPVKSPRSRIAALRAPLTEPVRPQKKTHCEEGEGRDYERIAAVKSLTGCGLSEGEGHLESYANRCKPLKT